MICTAFVAFGRFLFAPLPDERLFDNVAGEGGEWHAEERKLGENVQLL